LNIRKCRSPHWRRPLRPTRSRFSLPRAWRAAWPSSCCAQWLWAAATPSCVRRDARAANLCNGMTVGRTLWLDQLTDAEHALLEPRIPDQLDREPDVLVIGGGIIGCATAAACI